MKTFEKYERRGLPGGPNEMISYMTGAVSIEGYKSNSPDKYNDFNIIPSSNITMEGVDFPLFGMDNLGNMAAMMPGANYKFPGSMVFEMPMAQQGIEFLDPNRPISSQASGYTQSSEADRMAVQDAMNQANAERANIRGNIQRRSRLDEEAQALGFNNYEEYSIAKARENAMGVDNTFTTQASDLGMYNTYLPEITIQSKPEEPGLLGNLFPYGGAEALPFVGEGIDAIGFADAAKKGNYGDAALYALGFALPFVGGAALKRFFTRGGKQSGKATNNAIESEVRSLELANNPSIAKELAEPKPVKNDWTIEEILELPDDEVQKLTGMSRDGVELFAEKGLAQEILKRPNNAWTPTNAFVGKVDAARNKLISYYRSSEYKQRLRDGLGISSSEADEIIESMVDKVNNTNVNYNNYGTRLDKYNPRDADAHAGGNDIWIGEGVLDYDDLTIDDIIQHELGHSATEVITPSGKSINDQLPTLGFKEGFTYKTNYYGMPQEIRERGMSTLRYLNDNNLSIDDFLKMDLRDLRDAPHTVRQFKDVYEPTQQADYLKNIFSVAPIIGIGGVGAANLPNEMDTRQRGGEETSIMMGPSQPITPEDVPLAGTFNLSSLQQPRGFNPFSGRAGAFNIPGGTLNPTMFGIYGDVAYNPEGIFGLGVSGDAVLDRTLKPKDVQFLRSVGINVPGPVGGSISPYVELAGPMYTSIKGSMRFPVGGAGLPGTQGAPSFGLSLTKRFQQGGGLKQKDANREYNNTISPLGKTGYAEIRDENLIIPNPNEGKYTYQYQAGGELEQRAIAMGESPEYARRVQRLIDEGATIQDLASRRIGTVSGLSALFPDAEMGSRSQPVSTTSVAGRASEFGMTPEDYSRYYNRGLRFFNEGKTIDDLVNMRYGTREGLTRMFSDVLEDSSATYSPSPVDKPSPLPQQTPAQVSSESPTEIPAQPAMIAPEPIVQPEKDVDAGLAADAQMAREQMTSGSIINPNLNTLPLSSQFNFNTGLSKFLPIPSASTEPFFTVPEGTFRGPSSIEEINQRRAEQEEIGRGLYEDVMAEDARINAGLAADARNVLEYSYRSSEADKYTNIPLDEYGSYLGSNMRGYDQVINEAEQKISESTNTNSPYADDITETEINRRLAYDIPRYGEFMNNPRVVNRTGNLRQNDANIFFADVAKPNSVIIDIGAGLGNSNPSEAGISTYELFKNPKIQENNITVIASDIAPEAEKFITRENNPYADMDAYSIPVNEQDWSDINNYMTPIADILEDKGVSDTEDVYLRATNGIDILMDEDVTEKHFEHLGNTLTDKNITYVFNNTILYKPKGEKQFTKIGNVSNTGMDHKNPSWIGKEFDPTRRSHYLLNDDLFGGGYVPLRRFGGSMPSYQSGGSVIDLIGRKVAEGRAAAENVDKDAGFLTRAIQAITAGAAGATDAADPVTPDVEQVVEVVDKPKVTINPTDVFDADQLRKGVKYVESENGLLMMNPTSTATGLYGQLYSEFGKIPGLYSGTREEFAKDLDAQERIFTMRINDEIEKIPGLERNAYELTEEYLPQLGDKFNFTLNEVAALSNFLGRQGARKYFGNVLRDGMSLEEVFPDKYGPNAEQPNKTPEEYLEKFRKVVKEQGGETNGISLDSMGIDALSALMLPKYVDYINGVDESEEARRVYDKLNRKVYAYAKKGGMTAPNYIASNILKLGGSV